VIALMVALIGLGWIGFLGSDDTTYALGAYGWIEQFPYVGGHGTIRYTITVPIALSFLAFGENEFTLALPTLLYTFGLVALIFFTVLRLFGCAFAVVAAVLVATMPLLVISASIAGIDVIETLCIFGSLFLFLGAIDRRSSSLWFVAGVAAAFGFLTRETTIFLIVFYALVFLIGVGGRRLPYFTMGSGFLCIWLIEILWLKIATGDPFYRVTIALHHDTGNTINRAVDQAGNLVVHPAIDPFLVVLFNQEFALLFWAAVPAAIWLLLRCPMAMRQQRFVRVIAGFSLTWFVCVAAATSLLPLNPRYFMPSAVGAAILLGVAAVRLYAVSQPLWTLGIAAGLLLAANFAGVYVDNRHYMFGEYKLRELASTLDEPLKTDPATERRAYLLLRWANLEDRISSEPPKDGDLYVHNATRLSQIRERSSIGLYRPAATWTKIAEYHPRPKLAGVVLDLLGLDGLIPAGLWDNLHIGHPGVVLYRVGGRKDGSETGQGSGPDDRRALEGQARQAAPVRRWIAPSSAQS
jgi:4-amino-4-deoxy-L-arabinose transferase-like glycosyltransferase